MAIQIQKGLLYFISTTTHSDQQATHGVWWPGCQPGVQPIPWGGQAEVKCCSVNTKTVHTQARSEERGFFFSFFLNFSLSVSLFLSVYLSAVKKAYFIHYVMFMMYRNDIHAYFVKWACRLFPQCVLSSGMTYTELINLRMCLFYLFLFLCMQFLLFSFFFLVLLLLLSLPEP